MDATSIALSASLCTWSRSLINLIMFLFIQGLRLFLVSLILKVRVYPIIVKRHAYSFHLHVNSLGVLVWFALVFHFSIILVYI